ncbi:hypothetical protein [uncultured Gammaproteobacteria bacterium]|nr:hypothetical protein [uncultured Gammaproteobacteria bacterium]
MKEKFKKYLSKKYADSTVNSYLSGINHLSQNYGQDIFRVTDLNKVVEILHLYGLGGAKRPVGDYGNGSARNGIVQYHNFIKSRSRNEIEEDFIKPETISTEKIENRRFSYERDLHTTLKNQISELFPQYELIESEYSIENVRLDLLLQNDNELLVVELKAGVATYEVYGQISMYIGLVKNKHPEHIVKGLIIASEIHKGLVAACTTSDLVECKKYKMKLSLENA